MYSGVRLKVLRVCACVHVHMHTYIILTLYMKVVKKLRAIAVARIVQNCNLGAEEVYLC